MREANDLAECVHEVLREVIDPEIGINIVDVGLVYDVSIDEAGIARITMTTTTKGCPATSYLKDGAREAARSVAGVQGVEVQITYDPPWTPGMMSDVANNLLGF
ncbi:metal-sulfur cluster assembly factor [Rhodoblastus sp.]|jgi:metal-sulfur cluster biosynthetic enzyme|uniref:metal-sulfur cluster assembly factor n=1 Tax=Rhodoblastus sp. TaxID=1962975 RepID=UPI0025D5DC21|nr:metal-sulfur cluster assembly factor [Rhodoblastus sp.]